MTKGRGRTKDKMDGAFFPWDKTSTPQDFLDGPDGLRRGQTKKPSGEVLIRLDKGTDDKVLPPRFTWSKGHWKSSMNPKHDDWNTWVVSAEGTPGNFRERHYIVPDEIGNQTIPDHPADWPKSLREHRDTRWKSSSSTSSASAGLPWDLRVRCLGCGHFYKVNDLGDHVKNACPAEQDQPAMWVIACECHKEDLLTAATVLPGFPVKPPQPKEEKKGEESPLDDDLLKQAASDMPEKVAPDSVRGEAETVKGD